MDHLDPPRLPADEPPLDATTANRALVDLCRAIVGAEAERSARLEIKLAELDAHLSEAKRVERLIRGGASEREARLRMLERQMEELLREREDERVDETPRPLDIPRRGESEGSVRNMREALDSDRLLDPPEPGA